MQLAVLQLPAKSFTSAQWHQRLVAQAQTVWHLPVLFEQGDGIGIARQIIKIGAEMAGEGFEFIERARIFKGFGVELNRGIGGVTTGAAAGGFFFIFGVGCGIGSQEEFRATAGRCFDQRLLMRAALQNRQAVVVRANPAGEHMVAVVQQVVRSDGRGDIVWRFGDELGGIGGGNMFQHHF